MMKKNKLSYLILAVIFTSFLIFACNKNTENETVTTQVESKIKEDVNIIEKSSEEIIIPSIQESTVYEEDNSRVTEYNFTDILNAVAQKGNDWSRLPLSDNFRNTYNSDNGIINKNNLKELIPLKKSSNDYEKKIMKFDAIYTYDDPTRLFRSRYTVYFELDKDGKLDSVEVLPGDEIEKRAEPPLPPRHINIDSYDIFAYIFVLGEKRADPEVEFAVTDKFRNYYKDYEETGLLPEPNCEYLDTVFDLCNYSEKKVVLDAIYADKIIRYNVYYTEDADARLDSLTLVEDSVRERGPESKSE